MPFYRHLLLLGRDVKWLSKKLGVSHQTIYNWKNKKAKPSPIKMKLMSKLLSVSMEKLYKEFY